MTLKEFANMLNNREYKYPLFTEEEIKIAKENNFIIISGASDDLLEVDGAISDEADVWDGGKVYIRCKYDDNDNIIDGRVFTENYRLINQFSVVAKWCEDKDSNGKTICWTYDTKVPHETFDILEDGKLYCRALVIQL